VHSTRYGEDDTKSLRQLQFQVCGAGLGVWHDGAPLLQIDCSRCYWDACF